MTKTQIIAKFNLFMDDTSELSSTEESDLFDKKYNQVCSDRPWEWLRKAATGSLSTTLPYVSLPSDFAYVLANNNYTESSEEAEGPVVFVGTTYRPYKVISMADRRQYRDQDGYCYIDIVNSRLYFTKQPTSAETYEFDYSFIPTALAAGESPAFPARFHDVIYHLMCVDSFVIQQSDKAKSYAAENKQMANDFMDDMAYWNSQLIQQ